MTDRPDLLSQFIAAWNAGERPDPDDFLTRAPDEESETELSRELALFLEIAETPSYSDKQLDALRENQGVVTAANAYRDAAVAADLARARESRGVTLTWLAKRFLEWFDL